MGKTVKILRIERNGLGMYAASASGPMLPFATKASNRHPAPHNDEKFVENSRKRGYAGDFSAKHFFGFSSKAQLKRWLHSKTWLLWLCLNGYVLCEYTVLRSDTIIGTSQAVFVKAQTITRTEYKISEYFYGDSK